MDADPDSDRHQNNADPHADPAPSFTQFGEFFFTFIHSNASLHCFPFLISGKCVKILGTLGSILKFSRHNTGVGHRTTGSQLCSNISFKRKTVSKTKRFLAHIQGKFITFHKGTDKDLQSRFFTLQIFVFPLKITQS